MESELSHSIKPCKNCRRIESCKDCHYFKRSCKYCGSITLLLCNECENPNWSNWTSGNKIVDDFIIECNKQKEVLKWIPFNQFSEIIHLAKGGFGIIYKAKWKGIYDVVLKKLFNSQNITKDFLNEVKNHIQCTENLAGQESLNLIKIYGISYDPNTREFLIVSEYALDGDLKKNIMKPAEYSSSISSIDNYYRHKYDFSFNEKLIFDVVQGLKLIHKSGLVHCDLHIGNILIKRGGYLKHNPISISDFGLSQPANITTSMKSSGIYGIIPYIAPEIFLRKPYTPASDIYSLGIVIWVLHSFEQPYNNRRHDAILILDIIGGLRPEISPKFGMPNHIVELMKKCWDSNPDNRPTAEQIITTLTQHKRKPNESSLADTFRKRSALYKIMNLNNQPDNCYTSSYLSFQKVREHLAKLLENEDSGQNDLSIPTSIKQDDNIRDFGDEIIALPTLKS
ncbi:kinase-like domain-containing protein [Glomus cerebriforme]|uniref:Kinase-like domain-containing protein n=1 Tax=Glomus cerebriforme TaxID=658196 RepID=A0A397SDK7_9GLOM|nr:kinase-like domain-containing protein [Glomus cerebriforme]